MPLMTPRALWLAGFAAITLGPAHAAAPNMKEGLWEVTVSMEVAGMPGAMPAQTMQQCITQKDMQDPRRMAPAGADGRDNPCKVTDYRMQGNTASWNMACTGTEQMTGSGTMTYEGTRYSGTSTMTMKQGGQLMQMTMRYSGRYLGACK
jgi:hypothetical protein